MDPEVQHFPELITYRVGRVVRLDLFGLCIANTDELAIDSHI